MKTINTPLTEKFNILAYLQQEVKVAGNFSISYLKSKNMFQVSFVNGLGYKGQSPRIDGCIDLGINQLEIAHKEEHGKSYHEGYNLIQSNHSLKEKVKDLEERLRDMEEKYNKDCDFSKTEESKTGFYNYSQEPAEIILDKPKRKRGRPTKKIEEFMKIGDPNIPTYSPIIETHYTPDDYTEKDIEAIKKLSDLMMDEEEKENITEKEIIDSPIIWNKSDKKKKELRERTKARSRIFTEKEIEKEMRRLNSDLPTTLLLFRNTKKYEIERTKAYKRLTAKKYTKLSDKRQNLNVRQNKYNITKDDVITDMKRVLKGDFDTLSNSQYVKQWTLAKARVWNREYTQAKNRRW
jgi:hypothetical protein